MSAPVPLVLSELQRDALKEVGNIGAGHAATALSQLLNTTVKLSEPTIDVLKFRDLAAKMGYADKTVAALHRAAYLLYTHRRTLDRRGVLVIGPNVTFLRYISQVLPSLGETDVVLHTLGDLFPGVHATDSHDPAAVVKGDERMVKVLRRAVRDRQRVPEHDITVDADGVDIPLSRDAIVRARDRARSLRKPHNVARKLFVTDLLSELARNEARVQDRPLDTDIRRALWLTRTEIAALGEHLRSPMILQSIDLWLGGQRLPLEVMSHLPGDGAP